jgi:hypothetical protein
MYTVAFATTLANGMGEQLNMGMAQSASLFRLSTPPHVIGFL